MSTRQPCSVPRGQPPRPRRRCRLSWPAVLGLLCPAGIASAADLTSIVVVSETRGTRAEVPVTFGQVFKAGDVPAGTVLGATLDGAAVPLQVDAKATHADGSLRHAVLSTVLPTLAGNSPHTLSVNATGVAPAGSAPTAAELLATSFDVTINLVIAGTAYSASARELLRAGTPDTWLRGPVATEWLLSGPVHATDGGAHPHLQARFHVRAYAGLASVRVEAVLENVWAFEKSPRSYDYDVRIDVVGKGTAYAETGVTHYRQSRWRRVVWWGADPRVGVLHDGAYLQATRAVPTYDPRVRLASAATSEWQAGLGASPGVMSVGALEPYMPQAAGRFEIAPLPAFQAGYLVSQDDTARRVTIAYGEQAGAWPMHYRDEATNLPVSIDTHPEVTIIGASGPYGNFPACEDPCSSPLTPEVAHHPSLAYLPYLITGDYYLMEEMIFWADWVLLFGEAGKRGGSQGLVVWDQVRGQAWALRTLGQAAYLAPDAHPLKAYLNEKLRNNIAYFRTNWVDANPLGYVTNTGAAGWLGYPQVFSTWMDDFLTWSFGHLVGLGYTEARPVLEWKAKFPVGRLTDPGMCWKLAATNWVDATHRGYAGDGDEGAFVTSWTDWRRNVVYGWDEALRGTNDIGGREAALFVSACGSAEMNSILGLGAGEMIGWDGPSAYPANLQAAAAVAVEAGVPNAERAFEVLTSRSSYPLTGYGAEPQWALYPANAVARTRGTGSDACAQAANRRAHCAAER